MNVWYVCAAFFAVGAIVYVMFASGELQPWAVPPTEAGKQLQKDMKIKKEELEGFTNPSLINDEKLKNENRVLSSNFNERENTRF